MAKDINTLYCSTCGSTNVQIQGWIDPNTGKACGYINDPFEEDDCWRNNCESHEMLTSLQGLWDKFKNIPVNQNDEIEESFLCFDTGTSKFDVWHWFDERCPNNLHDDLMFPKQ